MMGGGDGEDSGGGSAVSKALRPSTLTYWAVFTPIVGLCGRQHCLIRLDGNLTLEKMMASPSGEARL